MKKNILVIFGGRSAEHDVSIITGLQACENLDKSKYNIYPIYITKSGEWLFGDILMNTKIYQNLSSYNKKLTHVFLTSNGSDKILYSCERKVKPLLEVDCCLLAMHGLHGEDGTLQGMLELKDIPYTSCGVAGSCVGMDKIIFKTFLKGLNLPILPWISFDRYEYENSEIIEKIERELNYPIFVKPANSGSSIGISKAENREQLEESIDLALIFDNRVLAESAVVDIMEVNCAVLGHGGNCVTSLIEQPITLKDFLTFEEKYMRSDGKSKGMKSLNRKIPADISKEIEEEIHSVSKTIFSSLCLSGVVRLDFIIDKSSNTLYVNEVNTIPGSFAFYLFEPQGMSFPALLDKLIELAVEKAGLKKQTNLNFDSELLSKAAKGSKNA